MVSSSSRYSVVIHFEDTLNKTFIEVLLMWWLTLCKCISTKRSNRNSWFNLFLTNILYFVGQESNYELRLLHFVPLEVSVVIHRNNTHN